VRVHKKEINGHKVSAYNDSNVDINPQWVYDSFTISELDLAHWLTARMVARVSRMEKPAVKQMNALNEALEKGE